MSEKLERLAEAQQALDRAIAEDVAVKGIQHATEFGRVATVLRVQGLTDPYDNATKLSSTERDVLLSALRAHRETTLSAVAAAESIIGGMLK